jgi:hypothetical protein
MSPARKIKEAAGTVISVHQTMETADLFAPNDTIVAKPIVLTPWRQAEPDTSERRVIKRGSACDRNR